MTYNLKGGHVLAEAGRLTKRCNHKGGYGCGELVHMIVDYDSPIEACKEPPKHTIFDDGCSMALTATVGHSCKRHPSGLCYYHLKLKENYFGAPYPLLGRIRVRPFGEGGLSDYMSNLPTFK